jgi:hypothetical protein
MKQLTEDEFDKLFTPVPDATGEIVRPDETGLDLHSTKLWTIIDADGSLYALSGSHRVNRIGYLITEEDWTEPTEGVWFVASDEDDVDEEDGAGA